MKSSSVPLPLDSTGVVRLKLVGKGSWYAWSLWPAQLFTVLRGKRTSQTCPVHVKTGCAAPPGVPAGGGSGSGDGDGGGGKGGGIGEGDVGGYPGDAVGGHDGGEIGGGGEPGGIGGDGGGGGRMRQRAISTM